MLDFGDPVNVELSCVPSLFLQHIVFGEQECLQEHRATERDMDGVRDHCESCVYV